MSGSIGRREIAVRCFAAEYEDASLEYSESDEERAPNYVVTPTGARVNRVFVVGVLTEVEPVSDDVLRARVVDPTGAFVIYAGQYQPDAKAFLERADPPEFVAVTGKARTFEPDDADVVYTSVRPESINAVDPDTRDRWTVQAARFTIDRVATCAAALDREERGEALREALLASDVDPALAAGIPRAIDHYGTTAAYLAAVREVAVQAAEVVAGERDEVDPLEAAPDEGGTVDADLAGGVEIRAAAGASGRAASPAGSGTEVVGDAGASTEVEEAAESGAPSGESPGGSAEEAGEAAAPADTGAPGDVGGRSVDEAEAGGVDLAGSTAGEPDAGADDLYEMDDEEREAIEAEYGTEFATGSEVKEPGEADIETPGPVDAGGEDAGAAAPEPAEDEASAAGDETGERATVGGENEEAADEHDAVDLVEAVVDAMGDLDDGDGADRDAVVEAVAADHDADREAVEGAIEDALMSGRCYEPEDGRLKAV